MKWNLMLAACLVVATILLFAGAPALSVLLGIALASIWCWLRNVRRRRASAGSN